MESDRTVSLIDVDVTGDRELLLAKRLEKRHRKVKMYLSLRSIFVHIVHIVNMPFANTTRRVHIACIRIDLMWTRIAKKVSVRPSTRDRDDTYNSFTD